jgi:hypothetical protein
MPTFKANEVLARISKDKQFLFGVLEDIEFVLAYVEHVNYEADPKVRDELTEIHARVGKVYKRLIEAQAAWQEKH